MIGHVLHVGAHPDDEDAGLMAFMAHKFGARIVYWSATRGEAGQNRVGPYSGDALGIYRTWESLAARAIDGGESLYGPFYDFGFSKNGIGATTKWGREALVREIVRAIRLVQPQILIARYTGQPSDGHGHHQAIGAATPEAFDAAADPDRFSELGLPAWRTPKFYQSTGGDWQPGEENALGQLRPEFENDAFLRIDTGEVDPLVGLTYQEQAWIAFNCHQTQAMGFLPERGSFYYYYKLKKSLVSTRAPERSFYDQLDPTLPGLVSYPGGGPSDLATILTAVRSHVDAALACLQPDDAAAAVDPLLEGLAILRHLPGQLRPGDEALGLHLDAKIASFEDVIVGCLGLDAECVVDRGRVTAGHRLRITGRLWNPRSLHCDDVGFRMIVPEGWKIAKATEEGKTRVHYEIVVAPDAAPTTPYWLREPHDRYRYGPASEAFACRAFDPAPVALECEVMVGGNRLTLRRPALWREPFAGGYRELPISVLPPVSVKPQRSQIFLPERSDHCAVELNAAVRPQVVPAGRQTVHLRITAPTGWTVSPSSVELPVGAEGETSTALFQLRVPGKVPAGRYRLEYHLGSADRKPAVTVDPVWMGAPGLPRPPDGATCVRETFLVNPACVDVNVMSAKFASGLRYGYVRGAAERLLDALNDFGLNIQVIDDEEMGYLDLSVFDGVIVGPNAYVIRDELRRNAGRFLDYVRGGGTLIVQYQAYGYELHDFAPYPFDYSHPHDRVTFPDAPVAILAPEHPLMTHPNRIVQEDFSGWIHDRGLYFLGQFDSRYTPILACADPGEELKGGGLVASSYGRGSFIYVGYSLFRQIPAAVPGAFRLLANLLALPEARLLERVERLKGLSLFSFMTDEQLVTVARIVSERYERAGAYLCHQGESGRELFVVMKGEIEIVKHSGTGTVVRKGGEGQVVGEFAILADIPRTADLRAATDVHLLVISGVHFRALIREHPEMAEHVIRQLVMKSVAE